jgi:sugar/nucleoside kinase (ribokinase family)
VQDLSFDVLVLGDLNPDIVVLDGDLQVVFGQVETLVEGIRLTIGGSAGIMAAGASRLGLKVAACGVVGDDELGRWMLGALAARGVDTRHCVVEPAIPTGATVALARGADRAILTALGSIDRLRAVDVPEEVLIRARHVHAASTALQPHLRRDLPNLFQRARAASVTSSFDSNWDPAERWDDLDGLLASADICFPNLEEGRRWTGLSEPESVAHALVSRSLVGREAGAAPLTVALKLGREGALALRGEQLVRAHPPRVTVLDTVGAGDSFDAGFVAAFVSGWPLDEALRLAVVCGSGSTRAIGGVDGQLTLDEAAELMARPS